MKVIKRSLKHIINPAEASKCVETQNYDRIGFVLFFYHLACISSMLSCAMFNQAILVEVLAVAVGAGEGVAIWHWTVAMKQK